MDSQTLKFVGDSATWSHWQVSEGRLLMARDQQNVGVKARKLSTEHWKNAPLSVSVFYLTTDF